jgi:hypothetical protein
MVLDKPTCKAYSAFVLDHAGPCPCWITERTDNHVSIAQTTSHIHQGEGCHFGVYCILQIELRGQLSPSTCIHSKPLIDLLLLIPRAKK